MKNRSIWSSFLCGFQGIKFASQGHIMRLLYWVFPASILLGIIRGMIFGPLKELSWVLLLIVCCFVWAFECLNTAVEELCDLVQPEYSEAVRRIKDLFPAASIFVGIGAVVGGLYMLIMNPGWHTLGEVVEIIRSGNLP